jgi:hypothetical protein
MRPIKTEYFARGDTKNPVRTTRSIYGVNAVTNAIRHMQLGFHDAATVVITDTSTAELHAVIIESTTGDIKIAFKRDPKTPRCVTDL